MIDVGNASDIEYDVAICCQLCVLLWLMLIDMLL